MNLTSTFAKSKNIGGIEHKKKMAQNLIGLQFFIIWSLIAYIIYFYKLYPILRFTFGFIFVFALINLLKISPLKFLLLIKNDMSENTTPKSITGKVSKLDKLGNYGFPTNYRLKLENPDNWFYSDKTLFSSLKVGKEITFTYTPNLKIIHEYSK